MSDGISIACVGDIALSDHPLLYGSGVRSFLNNGGELFTDINGIFRASDVVLGNLECPLIEVNDSSGLDKKTFCGDTMFSTLLKDAGFTVLNIANNHIMHHGPDGYSSTVSALDESGIVSIGGKANTANAYHIYDNGDMKIAFIGYSCVKERKNFEPLYFYDSEDELLRLIKDLKEKVDRVVLSIHWGTEDINKPNYDVIMFARKLCDSGVDIILGHHPHVLQAIENYNGSLIFYSLGNFVFDCIWSEKYKQSMIVELQLSKSSCTYIVHPVRIRSDYKIKLVTGEAKERFIAYINKISSHEYYQSEGSIDDVDRFNSEVLKEEEKLRFYKALYLIKRMHKMRIDTVKYLIDKII